jgi:putative transposase
VGYLRQRFGFSERRACALVAAPRATVRYQARRRRDDGPLRRRLHELAGERPRFGYRRLHALLRREGSVANHKRIERLYRLDGLAVRRRGRKRAARPARGRPDAPRLPNQQWALDFLSDTLASGRRIRVLAVVDVCTREALAIEVDTSLPGERVARVLTRIVAERGLPTQIVLDNGPELTGKALDRWAYERGVDLRFIDPGKPVQNAVCESFNGRFRDECLSQHHFPTLARARVEIETWRVHFNCERPHSSLDARTPKEFGDLVRCKVPPSAGAAAAPLDRDLVRRAHQRESCHVENRMEIN